MFDSAARHLALLATAPLLALATPAPAHADEIAPAPAAAVPIVRTAFGSAAEFLPTPAAESLPVPAEVLTAQVIELTNQQRNAYGCGELAVDQDLILASERQSWYMAETHNFSHLGWGGSTFEARARVAGYLQPAGENIAWGYPTAQEVMDAWMASPGHRANILNCAMRSIGAGVTYSSDGLPYYTQVFGWL